MVGVRAELEPIAIPALGRHSFLVAIPECPIILENDHPGRKPCVVSVVRVVPRTTAFHAVARARDLDTNMQTVSTTIWIATRIWIGIVMKVTVEYEIVG